MREKLLVRLAHGAVYRTRWMIIGVVILTILFGALGSRIEITPKWSDMLPRGDKRTVEFDRILEEFISASSIVIVVQGEEERIKAFADSLAPRLLEPLAVPGSESEKRLFVRRVDYKQEVDFIKERGFMLMKASELANMKDLFEDASLAPLLTHINNSFEREYFETEESLSTREKEDGAFMFLDGIESWLRVMERYLRGEKVSPEESHRAADNLLMGDPFFISYDRKALILNAIPNFNLMDIDLMVKGTDAVQAVMDETLKGFPGVRAGLTGTIPLGRDEMVYSMQGLEYTSLLALLSIGVLLMLSFRMWVAPLLALVNLVVGLIWAMGVVALFVPVLNIMTAMFVVVLLGLGIDFSIHIIAGCTEMMALGHPLDKAIREGLLKTGKGVMTGAVTTACAFLALMIGQSRALSEMGLVTGVGLLAVCVSSLTLLPSLLVIRERIKQKRQRRVEPRDISFVFLGRMSTVLKRNYPFTIAGATVVTILLVWSAIKITFDHNYMNIEVEGIPSITLQDTVLEKFDLSMDFAYLVAEGVEESRTLAEEAKNYASVAMVEDISLYLPSIEDQTARRPHIDDIHRRMNDSRIIDLRRKEMAAFQKELGRLRDNIVELQDMSILGGHDKVYLKTGRMVGVIPEEEDVSLMALQRTLAREKADITEGSLSQFVDYFAANVSDPERLNAFQDDFGGYFKKSVLGMANREAISLEMLPPSIVDRYANDDRTLFLVTVLPGDNIWQDARFLERFTDDLDKISERATGFPPVFRALIEIIGRDGRNAAMLTLIVVFLLLWIDFRHPGHALMAMIPLGAGMIWMVGVMQLVGDQLDVMNVMAIPMILGIGIDDGVHIVHRWKREGVNSERTVFASTGKAILLTSLTTMLAFGSLVFSIWRGYGSLGIALLIGVGTCFLTTVIILPGILGWIEK
ncbi:MAG: MMPL family transporter [Candidatus Neomarinimicrobiota bacterium]